MQGLTQVEEMLISRVLPIMSVYRLPHGQYGYSGHVINLPQDVASFATSLPRLPSQLDVIVVRRDGAAGSHRDFKVRRSVVLRALQWLLANNIYYRHVYIDQAALSLLPADGGQLPPVMDLPIYTTDPRSALSDLGSSAYQLFDKAIVLNQVMRQSGQQPGQVLFRAILHRMRNGSSTEDYWRELMKRTRSQLSNDSHFTSALYLHPTVEAVVEHNVAKLHALGQPIATINAVHTGPNASKASPDDAAGLKPVTSLAHGARIMLTANLWVEAGLVNGAMGTVVAICYKTSQSSPHLPVSVMVRFDYYSGPTLPDGTVPICPIRRTWSASGAQCSRQQLPLKLAWAVTIHKAQGMTLDKVVVNVGKKEFSCGLMFVACSRVRELSDLLLDPPPFTFQRIATLGNS